MVLKLFQKPLRMLRRNAELNDIVNAEFAVGEAETVIPGWYEAGITGRCTRG